MGCFENQKDEPNESRPPVEDYKPEFHYQFESTYYLDKHSDVKILDNGKRSDPFAARDDYKEVTARFKGKVRWLTLDEILHPHWLYEQAFEKRTYPQWLEVLDTWGEYTLVNRSICEKQDGGDVYDTFVLFQKLTEMACLMYKHKMYIPKSTSVKYYDHDEYPAFLNIDNILEPHLALRDVFLDSKVTKLKSDFNWWMDRAIQKVDVLDNDAAHRLHQTFMKTVKLLDACWVIKHADTETQKSWKKDFMRQKIKPINAKDGILNFLLDEEERNTPQRVVNWAFSRKRIGLYRDGLLECYEASFERKEWHIKPEVIEELRVYVNKVIEAAYLIHSSLYKNEPSDG